MKPVYLVCRLQRSARSLEAPLYDCSENGGFESLKKGPYVCLDFEVLTGGSVHVEMVFVQFLYAFLLFPLPFKVVVRARKPLLRARDHFAVQAV